MRINIVLVLVLSLLAVKNNIASHRTCSTAKLKVTINERGCREKRIQNWLLWSLSFSRVAVNQNQAFSSKLFMLCPVEEPKSSRIVLNCFIYCSSRREVSLSTLLSYKRKRMTPLVRLMFYKIQLFYILSPMFCM